VFEMTDSASAIFPFETPPELDADPEYAELRRDDPVPNVRLAPGGEAYLASRYEDVKRVFTDPMSAGRPPATRGWRRCARCAATPT